MTHRNYLLGIILFLLKLISPVNQLRQPNRDVMHARSLDQVLLSTSDFEFCLRMTDEQTLDRNPTPFRDCRNTQG
ncbi:hypothetical protein C8Q74DRAFT_442175 [Fomes fomentarius]|nr:hypothetical protein C8Q74DRAFT_442175 [Fomes fomentarius]